MAKKEGIISKWLRQRAEAKEEEQATGAGAGSFGGAEARDPTAAMAAIADMERALKAAEAESKAALEKEKVLKAKAEALRNLEEKNLEGQLEAQKEKARKELAEAQAKVEAARRKVKAERELEEMRQKIEAARAEIKARAARRTYTVESGDSLSAIAKKLYGNANLWSKIYEANKEVIGENPNLIHPGQEFVIPDAE